MNTQQLRNSILQEAIEGRLVPQDPNDEPASVLLNRIREEKKRLVKEGKLKKKDLEETPISEDEKPFEIPKSWEWCRIKDLFETSSGSTPQSKNPKYYSNGSINWVRTTDLNNGVLDSCEIKVTKEAVADYNLSIIPQDSVCIAMYGGGGTIGKHSIIKFDTTINQSVCAIFPNGYCDMNFVHVFMQYQRPYWMDYAAGSRKDPNINQIIIKNCLFPLPPLAEQKRIVAKIEELLPKVEEYGKAQDALNKLNEELPERLKKSILQEAITGRLVPQDPNDEPASVLLDKLKKERAELIKEKKIILGKPEKKIHQKEVEDLTIPKSWVWCQLNDICRSFGRIGFRGYTKSDLRGTPEEGAITLSPSNITNDILDLTSCTYLSWDKYNESPEIQVSAGDIILVKTASIGKCAFINVVKHEMTINPQFVVLKDIKVYNKFLYFLILSPYVQDKIKKYAIGTSIPTYSQVSLISMKIPLPPLAEQKRIVEKIEEVFKEIDKLKK